MKAIVYTSQTGFTRRYAEMLAAQTGLPAYDAKTAKGQLPRGSEIFYMGWLLAGEVKGLKAAMGRYTVRGVAIVGVSPQGNGELWTEARINGGASDDGGRIFYLRGGYAPEKLGGLYRLMMGHMAKTVIRQVATMFRRRPWRRSPRGSGRAITPAWCGIPPAWSFKGP